jgi:hypothetical protein
VEPGGAWMSAETKTVREENAAAMTRSFFMLKGG